MRVGPRLAEAADRHVHEVRTHSTQGCLADAHPLGRAGTKVLHEGIGAHHQAIEQLAASGLLEVEHQRARVAVAGREHGGHPAPSIAELTREVAAARGLDLEDVGALVGEHAGSDRSRDHRRQIDDPDAGERPAHGDHAGIPLASSCRRS